jgi:hypothetical protein
VIRATTKWSSSESWRTSPPARSGFWHSSKFYFRDPEGRLSGEAEQFFDEVNERLDLAGDFGEITIDEFHAWLGMVRLTYPNFGEPYWREPKN